MIDSTSERQRLEDVAAVYDPSNPDEEFDYFTKRLHREVLAPWLVGERVLEMGCATGELTSLMASLADTYHVVEGSKHNIEVAAARLPDVTFFHALWEEFTPEEPYTDVLLVCSLEHVDDPVGVLSNVRNWLAPSGRLHVIVPNADSLHRMVGVEMGILGTRGELSDSDVRIGHRRVYDVDGLRSDIEAAGYSVLHWQGIFLKFLANRQMLGWDWELIEALHRVGQRFPANCGEIAMIAEAT